MTLREPTRWGQLSPLHLYTPQTMVGCLPRLGSTYFSSRHGSFDRKLEVVLHRSMVPERRIARLSIIDKAGSGYIELSFRHLGLLDCPRPGQYAWQREQDGARRIQFPLKEAFGLTKKMGDRLEAFLHRSCWAVARATPEGVTVRMFASKEAYDWHNQGLQGGGVSRMADQTIRETRTSLMEAAKSSSISDYVRDAVAHDPRLDALDFKPVCSGLRDAGLYRPHPSRSWLEGDWGDNHKSHKEDRKEQAMLIPAGTKIVGCEFAGSPGKQYAYYTDLELAEGDYAVVVSPYDGNYSSRGAHYDERLEGHLQVVKVVSLEETVEAVERVAKWVVQKVDASAYAARVETQRQVALLTAKIKKAERAAREKLELEKLRDLSPELGELIDQMAALTGGAAEAKAD